MADRRTNPATWGIVKRESIAGFSIKELNQPPGRRLPRHEHPDASVCFVLSGSYRETARGREHDCDTRSVVFKPAGELHADQFGDAGGRCLLVEMNAARCEAIDAFGLMVDAPRVVRQPGLATLGRRVYREFRGIDRLSDLAVESLLLDVLIRSARDRATGTPSWLRRARELLHDNFQQNLSLGSLAAAVDVHPAHFARVFRRHFGTSVGEYVRDLRIEQAAVDLVQTNAPLAEIAVRAGFFDQSHFSRVFKQKTHQTPAAYRQAWRPR